MTGANTGGYEVAFVVADHEFTRLVQTAFIEKFASAGLPAEIQFDSGAAIPIPGSSNGQSAVARFFGRFDPPLITFDPFRDRIDTFTLTTPEHPANSIGITLPFRGSAFLADFDGVRVGPSNLAGDITLVAPFGYPSRNGQSPSFGINLDSLHVWLRFNDNDPDPLDNDRTTRDKIVGLFSLLGQTWNMLAQTDMESRLAEQLRSSDLSKALTGIGVGLDAAACPTGPTAVPARQVLLTPPATVLCVDSETIVPEGTSFLALKMKLTPRAVSRGVSDGALGQDWLQPDDRAAVLLTNGFLVNDLLPAALINALLDQEFRRLKRGITADVQGDSTIPPGQRRDTINQRFADQSLALARDHFTAPLTISTPVPMYVLLPMEPEFEEGEDSIDRPPNVLVHTITIEGVPNHPNSSHRMLQATLTLSGGVADLYTFDATVRMNIRFETGGGRPQVEIEADPNNQIDVHPNPLVYGIPAGLGALILGVFGPFVGGAIVLSTILPPMLLIFLANVIINIVASFVLPGILDGNFGGSLSAAGVDVLPFLFSGADLDDLVYRGELPVIEQSSINFQGFTPASLQSFRLNFDAARFDLPRLAEGATTPWRDAFTGVSAAESDVICDGRTVTPTSGVSLHHFGLMPVWRALNLGQTDLRSANFNITGALTLPLPDTLMLMPMASIDPLHIEDSADIHVHTLGLKTENGRFALLLLWNLGANRLRCWYRAYNQVLPGLVLLGSFSGSGTSNQADCTGGRDHTRTIEVPIALDELLSPALGPDGGLGSPNVTVPVRVGYQELECITRGTIEARPVLLLQPLSFSWTVTTRDGVHHPIAADANSTPTTIDVATHRHLLDGTSKVTFRLDTQGRFCNIETERGKSGSFLVEVTCVAYGGTSITAQEQVSFNGTSFRSVGYDTVGRLLDDLQRGARDPSTWPGNLPPIGPGTDPRPGPGTRPGPDPHPRPSPGPDPLTGPDAFPDPALSRPRPDPRNSLGTARNTFPAPSAGLSSTGHPALGSAGSPGGRAQSDPVAMRPTAGPSASGSQPLSRGSRAASGSAPAPASPRMEPKTELLTHVLQSFHDLPPDIAASAQIQAYMARIIHFVASLPDLPIRGGENEAPPPSQ